MSHTLALVYILVVNLSLPGLARTAFSPIIYQTTTPIIPKDCHSWNEVDCQDIRLRGHPDFHASCVEGAVGYISCPISCRLRPESDACLIYCEKHRELCPKSEDVSTIEPKLEEGNSQSSFGSGPGNQDFLDLGLGERKHERKSIKLDPHDQEALPVDSRPGVDPRLAEQTALNTFFKVSLALPVSCIVLYFVLVAKYFLYGPS